MPKRSLSAVLSLEARVSQNLKAAFGNVEKSVASLSKQARDFNSVQKRLTRVRDHWAKLGKDTRRFDAALKATNNTMRKQARILENLKKGRERLNKASAGLSGARRVGTRVAQGGAIGVAAIVASQARKVPNMSEQIAQLRKEGVSQADVFETILPKARDFSKEFNLGVSEVIDGFTMLKKAGYDVQPSIEALPNLFKLAKAESLEVADAFKVLNVSSNALGKPMKALERDLDKMSAVTSLTSLTGFDLANAMGAMGSVFASFEQANLDQFLAATIALNKFNTQLTGDEIKTRLRKLPQLIFRLQDPIKQTKDAATELARLKINTADFWEINPETGNKALKSFDQIFRMFAKRFDEMGIKGDKVAESYGRLIEEIESRDVAVAVTKALQTGAYDKSIQQLTQQLGIADKTRIVMDSLLGSLKAIPNALGRATNLLFFPDKATDSSIANIAKSIADRIDEMGVKLSQNRDKIAGFFDRLKEIIKAIIPIFTTFFKLIMSVPPDVWKWATVGVVSLVALTKVIGAVSTAFNLITGSASLFLAKGALFAALGPAGWVILGVAALAGGAALIIKNWSPIKGFFKDLWGGIKRDFNELNNWMKGNPIAPRIKVQDPKKAAREFAMARMGRGQTKSYDQLYQEGLQKALTSEKLDKSFLISQAIETNTRNMVTFTKQLVGINTVIAKGTGVAINQDLLKIDESVLKVHDDLGPLADLTKGLEPIKNMPKILTNELPPKIAHEFSRPHGQAASPFGTPAGRAARQTARTLSAQEKFAKAVSGTGAAKLTLDLEKVDNSLGRIENEISMQTRTQKAASSLLRHGLNRLGASIISSLGDKAYNWAYNLVSGRGGGRGVDSIVVGSRKSINNQAGMSTSTRGVGLNLGTAAHTWFGRDPFQAGKKNSTFGNALSSLKDVAPLIAGFAAPLALPALSGAAASISTKLGGAYNQLPDAVKGKLEEAGTNVGFATAEGLADGLFDRIGGNNVTINNTNTFNIQGEDDEERARKIMEELNKQTEENQMDAFVG